MYTHGSFMIIETQHHLYGRSDVRMIRSEAVDNDMILTIFTTLLILGAIWATIYNFYMSWFNPLVFLERSTKGVKDWWPFATYFKGYYGSSKWLWITRAWSTFILLGILFLAYKFMLHQINIGP
jgi:hypothetical protein